jgi:hypothetical protein
LLASRFFGFSFSGLCGVFIALERGLKARLAFFGRNNFHLFLSENSWLTPTLGQGLSAYCAVIFDPMTLPDYS